MTYVELIVVLSVFSILLGIAMYNHGKFQDKVAIKNLANEVALKIVEAQKSSTSGKWHSSAGVSWKPSYGVYFQPASPGSNRSFIYFADVDQDKGYTTSDSSFCPTPGTSGNRCLEKISLNRENTIGSLDLFYVGASSSVLTDLTVTFTRPDSSATILSTPAPTGTIDYAQITVASPSNLSAKIKIYPSGRIQIN